MIAASAKMAATISITDAASQLWDAIVIGAGPAGAVAARELARQGKSTVLVERQSFPRAKVCGGCLNGRAVAGLTALGLDHVLARAQALPLRRLLVQARQRRVELDLPAGVAIDRAAFDAELVKAAMTAGSAFLPETTAYVDADYSPSNGYRTVHVKRQGQQSISVTARIVLVADGLGHSSVRRLGVFQGSVTGNARIGLGLVVREPHEDYATGCIHMAIAADGYAGIVRTADGNLNVAAAVDPTSLKSYDAPGNAINRILAEAGMPVLRAASLSSWRGTLPLTRANSRLADDRVFLLGDAAGYVEPFTGEGMGCAIASAMSVVPYAIGSLRTWNRQSAQAWELMQQRRLARGQFVCRVLSRLLRQPTAVSLSLGLLSIIPSLASPVVRSIHAGPANLQVSFQ